MEDQPPFWFFFVVACNRGWWCTKIPLPRVWIIDPNFWEGKKDANKIIHSCALHIQNIDITRSLLKKFKLKCLIFFTPCSCIAFAHYHVNSMLWITNLTNTWLFQHSCKIIQVPTSWQDVCVCLCTSLYVFMCKYCVLKVWQLLMA